MLGVIAAALQPYSVCVDLVNKPPLETCVQDEGCTANPRRAPLERSAVSLVVALIAALVIVAWRLTTGASARR